MEETPCVTDSQILKIWDWCVSAYVQHGRKLSFPKGTDPSRTYQWRYVTAIAKKFREWKFDDATAQKVIGLAVAHSKTANVMQKGLAAILQGNILEVCYEKLQNESSHNSQTIASLAHIHRWVYSRVSNATLLDTLVARVHYGAWCNMTLWYQATKLTPLYMALSKPCTRALASLESDEREMLPKQTTLYIIRSDFLEDKGNVAKARELLGSDWR